MTPRPSENPATDVLRVLALSRSTGALEIRGALAGTIYLHQGEITYAEGPAVPSVSEDAAADPNLPEAIHACVVETGLTLLTGPGTDPDGGRPLFRPGRRHWTGLTYRLEVGALLAEIDRLLDGFAQLGVNPDDRVRLCGLPPGQQVVLGRSQWALVAALVEPHTARSLAQQSGGTLSATIAPLATLVAAGVVQVLGPEAVASSELAATAAGSTMPRRRLPARVRGATSSLSAAASGVPAGSSAAAAATTAAARSGAGSGAGSRAGSLGNVVSNDDGGPAVALRLLEGLRRL